MTLPPCLPVAARAPREGKCPPDADADEQDNIRVHAAANRAVVEIAAAGEEGGLGQAATLTVVREGRRREVAVTLGKS